jgi:NADPH:quinone reductase-like Zn-dependent oxidoreductase
MSSAGPNIAAVIEEKGGRFKISTRPVPTPGEGEILVRNHAIAGNPVDWKIQDYSFFIEKYPNVLGSDVAGVVQAIGPGVRHFRVGHRVTGFSGVIYNQNIDHGAWQTYALLPELGSSKIPASMSFEDASVFPMAMATGAVALFHELECPRDGTAPPNDEALLIWSAASSLGASAVQIAREHGWAGRIFATASPRHHNWLRNLGVTEIFDYHDADVAKKLAAAASARGFVIKRAYDSISEGGTFDLVRETLLQAGGSGGIVTIVLPWAEGKDKPTDINIATTLATRHAMDLKDLGRWFFNEWLEKALADGNVVAAPEVQVVDGGVSSAQKVLDMLRTGMSGKKLVVQVA